MREMFTNAKAFNQPIGSWNVSAVLDMYHLFRNANAFNQNIGGWNLLSVSNMGSFFNNANALSDTNKGLIHKTFSSNPNWTYDWSEFVVYEPITDANFQDAVNLWFSDEANATYTYGHIRDWNASLVTDMSEAFKDRTTFNEDISDWGVSSVENVESMFQGATTFNQPIGDWDISSVASLAWMFDGDWNFNQPINNWNTSSVVSLRNTFKRATAFDQSLENWDVSSVIEMLQTFYIASSFNQNLEDWNTSSVTNYSHSFHATNALSNTNKGHIHKTFSTNSNWPYEWSEFVVYEPITDANFQDAVNLWFSDEANATYTYGHIRDWNVSLVTDMSEAFLGIGRTSMKTSQPHGCTNMKNMFRGATAFNQSIGDWDVSNVTNMEKMFNDEQTGHRLL